MNCTRNGIAIAAACLLGVSALSAQVQKPAPAAKSSAWVQGKTADGQPDMQGTWTNATNVPFQRPKELGAKEFFTPQEQADFQANAAAGILVLLALLLTMNAAAIWLRDRYQKKLG